MSSGDENINSYKELKEHVKSLSKKPKLRVEVHYGIADMYKHYKTQVVDTLQKPYSLYTKILKEANIAIVDKILKESEEIKLPGVGRVRIRKKKMSFKDTAGLRINWKATKASGVKVYHTNDHRNNYRYRFFWYKQAIKGIKPYAFIPSRENKRKLAKILLNDRSIDYHE